MIYLRCSSHRARERLLGRLPGERQAYYVRFGLNVGHHRGIYGVSEEEAQSLGKIKGVTRTRLTDDQVSKCWK